MPLAGEDIQPGTGLQPLTYQWVEQALPLTFGGSAPPTTRTPQRCCYAGGPTDGWGGRRLQPLQGALPAVATSHLPLGIPTPNYRLSYPTTNFNVDAVVDRWVTPSAVRP